jgi:dihydroorotase/N-acyl-D-amino-acid deacylase
MPLRTGAAVVLVALLHTVAQLAGQGPSFDLLIRNGRVVDGTGSPWFSADLAVRGDTIVAVGPQLDGTAARTIDARNAIVSPGFIDLHVHAFGAAGPPPDPMPIVELPTADNYVRQGVTTLIGGPDGFSPIELRQALDRVAATGISPNVGAFVGHGSVRQAVLGDANRAPSAGELERMRGLVRSAMHDGAFGMSTGLFYVPAVFADTVEVVELAKVARFHISHMRDEAARIVDSVRENVRVGEDGGIPTQVTHHKAVGRAAWGKTAETLKLIDNARQRGIDVTLDVYPYTASATSIQAALIPTWAQEGGRESMLARLRDPATRGRIVNETAQFIREERGGGDPHNVQISRCAWKPDFDGKRLDDIAVERGLTQSVDDAAETALWLVENGGCGGIYHAIQEEDVQRVIRHPAAMIASDGGPVVFGRGVPHPRSYGTFVRVLSRYVRELKVLALEDAVRKMTSFPARRIGITDRGVIRVGMKADLVVFDPATVRDTATFESPHRYAEGVVAVFVNGVAVVENGKTTSARPGRILRKTDYMPWTSR